MKGRNRFTPRERDRIRALLGEKQWATRSEQKRIRREIRNLGFFISDHSASSGGFTAADFDALVKAGTVSISTGSPERDIASVEKVAAAGASRPPNRDASDEAYVLDLCDEALGRESRRQHRFSFLTGDTGVPLPADAYYPDISLVVEYHERQHSESVPFFDRRITASGVSRGKQRRIYDERRRDVLPAHGIAVVELSFEDFSHRPNKRLTRKRGEDLKAVARKLADWQGERD